MIEVYRNFSQIATLKIAHEKDGRNLEPCDLGIIKNSSIVFDDEKILWVGPDSQLPEIYINQKSKNFEGHTLTPEIVDSHTHLVFGGDRSFEYSMRLNGSDYQEIATAGGGILATMDNTIKATEQELFDSAVQRIKDIYSYGVGTIEIKSGYGLTYESELKIANVIHKLKKHFSGKVQILNTFLAAHAVPKNFKNSKAYIDQVVLPLLKELQKKRIIDFVDIFHEEGYFDENDSKTLFDKANEYNIKIKIHADEFNDNKGAILASKYNAVSADHLLCTEDDGIKALANSNTVATLLPGTAYFLGKPLANAQNLLSSGCKVALASDYNPGSCHCDNLVLIASICAKTMNFNLTQLWSAITLNAAHALDLKNQGALIPGLNPRFSIFKTDSIDKITYSWGKNFSYNLHKI